MFAHVTFFVFKYSKRQVLMYQSNRSFNTPRPSGQPPGRLNFWKFLFKFPPHRAEKLFKCPHPRENYQITVLTLVASIMHLKLCRLTWFIRRHIFIYYKHKSFLNTFKYGTHSLCRPLVFNQPATNTQSFPLNSSKFDVSPVSAMVYLAT